MKSFIKEHFKDIIIVGIAIYLLVLLITQQGIMDRNRASYKTYQSKISEAETENKNLKSEYDMVGSDEYIEEKAREAGLVRSDEIVFVTGK